MIYITCVYEDEPTHHVMLKMFNQFHNSFSEGVSIFCNGFGKIKKNIMAYNKAAKYGYYFVITDLDNEGCAPSLIEKWLPANRNDQLLLRVAVHEIESWLLADRESFSSFFAISREIIPARPDTLADPKQTVISLAKKSRKRSIRNAFVPIDDHASIGPGYNLEFRNYIQNHWNIAVARKHSPSLEKAMIALSKIAGQ
jgi:hypothetical protein